MAPIADSKGIASNTEWKVSMPKSSFKDNPVSTERVHNGVLKDILQVIGGWKSGFVSFLKMVWGHGAEDPRRFFHSLKVGVGLVLVSLFYFVNPLSKSTGGDATWAVMTVVVVFEYTAGATLCKGFNRIIATVLGGLLAVGVDLVARKAGHTAEPYIISVAVFLLSMSSTFTRLFPKIKAKYDYGFMILILTFSFMAVFGYRDKNIPLDALRRLETIIVGCFICILISLLIFPVWAGEDLHKLIISNLEGLAVSLEGCVAEYFMESSEDGRDNDKSIGYKRVLNSKASEELLANFAQWEFPPHGQFGFKYPWKQYVHIGARIRYCAYCVEALNGCLNSEIQAPYFMRKHLKEPCMNIAAQSAQILLELADSVKTLTRSVRIDFMTYRLNKAVEELQYTLTSQPELFIDSEKWLIMDETSPHDIQKPKVTPLFESTNQHVLRIKNADDRAGEKIQGVAFRDTLPLATVASLLTEIVPRLQTLTRAVEEFAAHANFKAAVLEDKTFVGYNGQPHRSTANLHPSLDVPLHSTFGEDSVPWRWTT